MKFVELTPEEFEALVTKDRHTFYLVRPSSTREYVDFMVFKNPDKMDYNIGEALDLTGCLLGWVCNDGTWDYFSYEVAVDIDPPNGSILQGDRDFVLFTMLDPDGKEWTAMLRIHIWGNNSGGG